MCCTRVFSILKLISTPSKIEQMNPDISSYFPKWIFRVKNPVRIKEPQSFQYKSLIEARPPSDLACLKRGSKNEAAFNRQLCRPCMLAIFEIIPIFKQQKNWDGENVKVHRGITKRTFMICHVNLAHNNYVIKFFYFEFSHEPRIGRRWGTGKFYHQTQFWDTL